MRKTVTLKLAIAPKRVSWYINRAKDFTGEVVQNYVDSNMLTSMTMPVDFKPNDIAYVKAVIELMDGTRVTTETMLVTYNSKNTSNEMFVHVPRVYVDTFGFTKDYIKATIPEPSFFIGEQVWNATSWRCRDLSGNVFFSRAYDVENKSSLEIPESFFKGHNSFTVEAQYEFDIDLDVWGSTPVVYKEKTVDLTLTKSELYADTMNTIALVTNRLVGFTFTVSVTGVDNEALDYKSPVYNSFELDGSLLSGHKEVIITIVAKKANKKVVREYTLPVIANKDRVMSIYSGDPESTILAGMPTNIFKATAILEGKFPVLDMSTKAISLYSISGTSLSIVNTNALSLPTLTSDKFTGMYLDSDTFAFIVELGSATKLVLADISKDVLTLGRVFSVSPTTNSVILNSKISYISTSGEITETDLYSGETTVSTFDDNILSGDVCMCPLLDESYVILSTSGEYFFTDDNVKKRFTTDNISSIEVYPSVDGAIVIAGSDFGFSIYKISTSGVEVVSTYNNVISDYRVIFDVKQNKIYFLGA